MSPQHCPRIFCIGRNYAKHIEELGDADAERCIVFMKPPSCLVPPGGTIEIPRGQGAVHHEAEVVVRIGDGGRKIPRQEALAHVDAVTLGLDLTLRDLQNTLKAQGGPWERCKAFEHSAPTGEFVPCSANGIDLNDLQFSCHINGELRQQGSTADLLFPIDRLIEILSQTWNLGVGDLIFTGTPEGVGPIEPGDEIRLQADGLGEFSWSIA